MSLSLCYFGDPVLRQKAEPVDSFDAELAKLAKDMVDTMHTAAGIGLAGPQVGVSKRIFVMEVPIDMDLDEDGRPLNPGLKQPLVVINPEIESSSEELGVREEGCLSIPEVNGNVERPFSIELAFQDVKGAPQKLELKGLAARCAQHELDHLNGVLFIDYLSSVKKVAIKGRLKKIKAGRLR